MNKLANKEVLLLGMKDTISELATKIIQNKKHKNIKLLLLCTDELDKYNSKLDDLIKHADVIIITEILNYELLNDIIFKSNINQKKVITLSDISRIEIQNSTFTSIDDTVLSILPSYQLTKFQMIIKRVFDLIFSSIILIFILPICVLIGVLVHLQDKGPAFFIQERPGLNMKSFNMIKFRSMSVKQPDNLVDKKAIVNDTRITKLGKFIRATRIDELPQLINVIKGEMSLVGPRPLMMSDVNDAIKIDPEFIYRYNVKPGLTGLQQVKTRYSSSWTKRLKYDLMYIHKYSLLLDIKVILLTIIVMFDFESGLGKKEYQLLSEVANELNYNIITDNELTILTIDGGE